jgi:hypothetical protein
MPERFTSCFPRSTGEGPVAGSPPPVASVVEPSMAIRASPSPTIRSQDWYALCLSRAKTPRAIHSSRRLRMMVAEQVASAIAW